MATAKTNKRGFVCKEFNPQELTDKDITALAKIIDGVFRNVTYEKILGFANYKADQEQSTFEYHADKLVTKSYNIIKSRLKGMSHFTKIHIQLPEWDTKEEAIQAMRDSYIDSIVAQIQPKPYTIEDLETEIALLRIKDLYNYDLRGGVEFLLEAVTHRLLFKYCDGDMWNEFKIYQGRIHQEEMDGDGKELQNRY